jgi:hypothetical protein
VSGRRSEDVNLATESVSSITWRPTRGKEEDVRINFTDICEQKWEVGNNCFGHGEAKWGMGRIQNKGIHWQLHNKI